MVKWERWPPRVGISVIGWGPNWQHPGEVMADENGVAYSPDSGDEVVPQPTRWAHWPTPPERHE